MNGQERKDRRQMIKQKVDEKRKREGERERGGKREDKTTECAGLAIVLKY